MKQTAFRWLGRSSVVAVAVAFASACAADAPVGPGRATVQGVTATADVTDGNRLPDLTGCEQLAAPAGSTLVLDAYGVGVQIYQWNGTSWAFVAPSATLFADAGDHGVVATHFGGPTWKSNSGGTVVGTVADRCPVDPASIPWVSLTGVADGPGIFEKVTFIQRLNTVGGNAPSTPGSLNEIVKVPYTANYLFYKAP
ncbi:MAG TPA: DUF3455 domain-containing protein [Gemmatimonadaceae bacterium]|nr:DUF3455 domain-containing protein [Gemmatimonadaceae bacterium]